MKKSALILFVLSLLIYFSYEQKNSIINQLTDQENSLFLQSIAAIVAILSAIFFLLDRFVQGNKNKPARKEESKNNNDSNELFSDERFEPTPINPSFLDKDKSPYRGLEAFKQENAEFFYGRQTEISEVLPYIGRKINAEQVDSPLCYWLQIQGNSGVGKSSFVKAGLLPKIEADYLHIQTGFKHWKVIDPMLPSERPINSLASVLGECFITDPNNRNTEELEKRLRKDDQALANILKEHSNKGKTALVLVVDQFEELFTFADKKERKHFDALLANAIKDKGCPLCLITTVRLDFLSYFEKLPKLSEMYNRHCKAHLLNNISKEGLIEVIEKPAEQCGIDVSEVITEILNDAEGEESVLPLVENALQILWQNREGNKLSIKFYKNKGGLVGLLEDQADELLQIIGNTYPKGKQHALDLLLALTRTNLDGINTRRRITLEEALLNASGGKKDKTNGQKIINDLTGGSKINPNMPAQGQLRLITTIGDNKDKPDEQFVDLVHELLIKSKGKDSQNKPYGYWKTLYSFIAKNRARSFYRDQIELQTNKWLKAKGLMRWWQLASWRELKQYHKIPLDVVSDEQRYRKWSLVWAGSQVLVIALIIGFVGQSFLWTQSNGLPPSYMLVQQQFRLIYWLDRDKPYPEMVKIPETDTVFRVGEYDEAIAKDYNSQINIQTQNFGFPIQEVKLQFPFDAGRTEVTYLQHDYYVWEQNKLGKKLDYLSSPPIKKSIKTDRQTQAVVNIKWTEANAYIDWLNEKLKHESYTYRLPTESEWEYAARAGTKTAHAFEDKDIKDNANCRNCNTPWAGLTVAPVASYKPNAWGLYDMHGNVWEWTCTEWEVELGNKINQCKELDKAYEKRVLRGGSWNFYDVWLRSSARFRNFPDTTVSNVGFRVFRFPRTN